eukprot:scaffold3187_cov34-Tisochrysis_lutea.AAC.1
MSGIEPPPLPPSQPTSVLSTRTSPLTPASQDSQQQQQLLQGSKSTAGGAGNINLQSEVPPTAPPGEAVSKMPDSPFAGGSARSGEGAEREMSGNKSAAGLPQPDQPGPSSALSGGAGSGSALQPVPSERKLSHTESAFSGLESGRVPSATDLASGESFPRCVLVMREYDAEGLAPQLWASCGLVWRLKGGDSPVAPAPAASCMGQGGLVAPAPAAGFAR